MKGKIHYREKKNTEIDNGKSKIESSKSKVKGKRYTICQRTKVSNDISSLTFVNQKGYCILFSTFDFGLSISKN